MGVAGTISVVICAYTERRWSDLVLAVESLQQQTLAPTEVIIVIDHNPALLVRAREHFSGIVVTENQREKGLSGARNTGWLMAKGDIIAYLDDDAIAEPGWLENLAASYVDPQVAGVGGKILPLWSVESPDWFPEEFNWVIGCAYRGLPTSNAPIRNMIGANMSMRRSILATVGGFRESFGCDKGANNDQGRFKWLSHYAGVEETEFCIRVSEQLPENVWMYAPGAVVRHRVSAERARWHYYVWRCYDEGLGKASLAKLHSTSTSLESERSYTLKTLPTGVLRGVTDTLLRRDPAGVRRAAAIVAGLGTTTFGYFLGSVVAPFVQGKSERGSHAQIRPAMEMPTPVKVG